MTEKLPRPATFRLFPQPSFLEGMGRILDVGQGLSLHNILSSAAHDDFLAIASDWDMVGADFKDAIGEYEQEE